MAKHRVAVAPQVIGGSRGVGIHLGQLANLQQGSRPSRSRGGGHVVFRGSEAGGRRCGGLLRAMCLQWLMLCLLAAAVSAPSHAPALLASRCSGLRHGLQPHLLPAPRIVYFRHASGHGHGELPNFGIIFSLYPYPIFAKFIFFVLFSKLIKLFF